MSYKSELVESLKKSLKSPICSNALVKLEFLNERVDRNGDITYRLQDESGNPIESLDALAGLLDESNMTLSTTLNSSDRYTNLSSSISLTFKNIFAVIQEYNPEDAEVRAIEKAYGKRHITFTLTYMNDNDKDIPMKLIYTSTREVKEDEL